MKCKFQIEIDEFCCRVLEKHWPDVKRYGDIRKIDWDLVERVDLLVGGFPCQSVSLAGKRLGIDDERWLWPEFARAIRGIRPRYVLIENTPGLLVPIRRNGRIIAEAPMGEVLRDLAEAGYDAEWQVLSAAQFGAPHLRERVFILAYPTSLHVSWPIFKRDICGRFKTSFRDSGNGSTSSSYFPEQGRLASSPAKVPDSTGERCSWTELQSNVPKQVSEASPQRALVTNSNWWLFEPPVDRVAPRTANGVDRLRVLGNAIVPQVMEYIGRLIIQFEQQRIHKTFSVSP